MDLVQKRKQLRQRQVEKVKKFRQSNMSASAAVEKQKERDEMKKEIRKEIEKETQKESMNIQNSDGVTFARVMDIIGPANMKPVVSNGVWKGTEQIGEAKVESGRSDYGKASVRNKRKFGKEGEPAIFDASNERGKMIDQRRAEHKAKRGVKESYSWRSDDSMRINKIFEGEKKGLWDNIHAKRKRGEKPAKPGDKDYPKTLDVDEGLKQARKNVGADTCWDGYTAKGTKKKGGKEVPNCVKEDGVSEGAAWTKKSGKSASGGLNEKGRKSYERENPGSDLKAPQPEGGSRKKSFCARMGGMKKKLTSSKTANDPDSRINKALRKWKC